LHIAHIDLHCLLLFNDWVQKQISVISRKETRIDYLMFE